MTAEIAVYNKLAVALAADSAVTIRTDNSTKISNDANKLFQLSKSHPVGIMVYGNGSFYSISWELIIKSYRKNLSEQANSYFNTIQEYADSFLEYLANLSFINKDEYLNSIYSTLLSEFYKIFVEVSQKITWESEINDSLNESEAIKITDDNHHGLDLFIEIFKDNLLSMEYLYRFSSDDIDAIKNSDIYGIVKEFSLSILENQFYFDENFKEKKEIFYQNLVDNFVSLLCKNNINESYTGIVFSGYGHNEYTPQIRTFAVNGIINNKLRCIKLLDKSNEKYTSGVMPFAQEEETLSFIHGSSNILISKLDLLLSNAAIATLDYMDNNYLQKFITDSDIHKSAIDACITEYRRQKDIAIQNFSDYTRKNYSNKVIDMISFFSKKELANMAYTLVNLTAFKRKVSNDQETVGGDIDVAVISKYDGFIWIQRKHYFKKELNGHYKSN